MRSWRVSLPSQGEWPSTVVSGAVERRGVLPCYGPRCACCCSLGIPCSLPTRGSGPAPPGSSARALGRWVSPRPVCSAAETSPDFPCSSTSGALYRPWPSPAQPFRQPFVAPGSRRGGAEPAVRLAHAAGQAGAVLGSRGSLRSHPLLQHHRWGCGCCLGPGQEGQDWGCGGAGPLGGWKALADAPAASGPLPAVGGWRRAPAQRCPWDRNSDLVVQPRPVISAHSRSRGQGGGLPGKSWIHSANFTFFILLYPHRR